MVKLNAFRDMYSEDEIRGILGESGTDFTNDIDFEAFLKVSNLVSLTLSFFNVTTLGNFFPCCELIIMGYYV